MSIGLWFLTQCDFNVADALVVCTGSALLEGLAGWLAGWQSADGCDYAALSADACCESCLLLSGMLDEAPRRPNQLGSRSDLSSDSQSLIQVEGFTG